MSISLYVPAFSSISTHLHNSPMETACVRHISKLYSPLCRQCSWQNMDKKGLEGEQQGPRMGSRSDDNTNVAQHIEEAH